MGKVYVKKGIGDAISNLIDSTGLGQSTQKVLDEAAKRQLANFDYSRNPGATPLYGDKDAGSLGPKDRHGNQQWIPANAAGRHDMDMERNLAGYAARALPYSRLISGGLGALSAIDSLANAQPGQSGLGMLHNAATRGYLSHIGAKSFTDPIAAARGAASGRKILERTNPYNLMGARIGPALGPAPAPAPAIPPAPMLPANAGHLPQAPMPLRPAPPNLNSLYTTMNLPFELEISDPKMEEAVQNPNSIDGTGVMENMSPALENQYAYLREFDTNPVASPTGYATPSPSGYTIDDHQRLLDEYGGS